MATVKIAQGPLRGAKCSTESGYDYYEFLGIPYAKPPVGDLRFKNPQPPESWQSERDATKIDKNNISCQLLPGSGKCIGNEDCLYLNVFTPKCDSKELLPVLVYLHGGGFVMGNGVIKSENGPDFLIENDIVLVTLNYRLGVLGFLSLDIPEASGNMGLKDQVKALQWVAENINKFGGDKNNVTLMGVSAGAASVEYLMLSPLAKGLFHRGIMQSGSVLNHWVSNRKKFELTQLLLKSLNYQGPKNDHRAIYEFLLTIPSNKITKAASQATIDYGASIILTGYVPTMEKDFGNGECFLTKTPYKAIKEGNFYKVPVIKSFCNREGILMTLTKPKDIKHALNNTNFVDFWSHEIDFKEKEQYNKKFTDAYLKNGEKEDLIEDYFGDLDFVSGIWISANLMSKHIPVYVCEFNYEGNINYLKALFRIKTNGALHGDDISYLWKIDAINNPDTNDILVRKRMTKMFTDFAKTGKPVPAANDLIPVTWPVLTEQSQVYLSIDAELSHKFNYEPKKMTLFEELYLKYYD